MTDRKKAATLKEVDEMLVSLFTTSLIETA